jgi:hypothetical protein
MTWPTPQDYNEAIQNPSLCFHDADLKAGSIECNALGLPKSASGAFASVFKLTTADGPWAIRCFLRFLTEQTDRYKKISQFVLFDNLECTVDFHYIEKGILVRGAWYPILKMRWIHGETLDLYIQKHHKDAARMSKLVDEFYDLVIQLENADIAHGDLQHGNILVTADGLRLVDYDALFVPALSGLRCLEFGHPNYQHPLRSPHHFDPTVDNFSTWLIHASLLAIRIDPSLFTTHLGGDESILFKRKDLASPETSPLFKALLEHESEEIKNIAQILIRMLWANPCDVPPLHANAYQLSALPSVQPYSEPSSGAASNSPEGISIQQTERDLDRITNTTTAGSDGKRGKFQRRKQKFRFKATAQGLSKSARANVVRIVDNTFRKSAPLAWTSRTLREGDRCYDLGHYEQAITVFMKVQNHREDFLNKNPNELVELQLRLGRTFAMMDNLNMACNYFLMASKTAEGDYLALQKQRSKFLLAMARHQSGKEDDAYAIIDSLKDPTFNLEELIKRESRFRFLENVGTLKLIEKYAFAYTEKGDLKKSAEILEIGRDLCRFSNSAHSPAFRQIYLDLLLRLGCTYARLGYLTYSNGIAVQAERLIIECETTSLARLRVGFYSACVYKNLTNILKLHPALTRLASTLRGESIDLIETAVKSFYSEFGSKTVLAVLATAAGYLNDHHVQKKAVEVATLAWQLLLEEPKISIVDKLRWLKNLEPSLQMHCVGIETQEALVSYVEKNIKNNRALEDTELVLAALKNLGKNAEPVTIAVLDEMVRVVKKFDYAFSVGQVNKAKALLQQYDFSNTRTRNLDGIDGSK